MRYREFIAENKTTLNKLYHGNFPDRDETFWDYVRTGELDVPLQIKTLPKYKLTILLQSQYRVEHLDEILDMMDEDQREVLDRYMNDPELSNRIIVLSDNRIIDGNHRALAAAMKGVSINYVDLADLDEQDVAEDTSKFGDLAEKYKAHLVKTLPLLMDFLSKASRDPLPSQDVMLDVIEAGYQEMLRTGDKKLAGAVVSNKLKSIMSKQGVAEGLKLDEGIIDFIKRLAGFSWGKTGDVVRGSVVADYLEKNSYHSDKKLEKVRRSKFKLQNIDLQTAEKYRTFTDQNAGGDVIDVDKMDRARNRTITYNSLIKNPPVLDRDGFVWDGNHRIQRAIELELDQIPVLMQTSNIKIHEQGVAHQLKKQGVAEGLEGNDEIARLKSGGKTSDGIGWQDIRLLAGEGKLTQKTIKQAIDIIRRQRKQQSVTEDTVDEMALQTYKTMGDFSKPGPFTGADKKLVPHPKNIEKATRFFEQTPFDFRLFFSHLRGTGKYSEHGPMSHDQLRQVFGKDAEEIINGSQDAITVVYVGNKGDAKVMLTPWMMAHRFGHAINAGTRNQNWTAWREAEKYFFQTVNSFLAEHYGKVPATRPPGRNMLFQLTPEYNALFNAMGTQRSSKSGQIRRPYEFLYELFAQYLGTGKVTLNPLPTNLGYGRMVFGNPTKYMNIKPEYRDESERKQAADSLAYTMELLFNDVLGDSVGKIFVM